MNHKSFIVIISMLLLSMMSVSAYQYSIPSVNYLGGWDTLYNWGTDEQLFMACESACDSLGGNISDCKTNVDYGCTAVMTCADINNYPSQTPASCNDYTKCSWYNIGCPLDGSGTQGDPWQVTDCMTLSQDGFYALQNDVAGEGAGCGNCFVLNTSSFTLDCQGHKINDSFIPFTTTIITGCQNYGGVTGLQSLENVEIKNCNIEDASSVSETPISTVNGFTMRNITFINSGAFYLGADSMNDVLFENMNFHNTYMGVLIDGDVDSLTFRNFNVVGDIIPSELITVGNGVLSNVLVDGVYVTDNGVASGYMQMFIMYDAVSPVIKNVYVGNGVSSDGVVYQLFYFEGSSDVYFENVTVLSNLPWFINSISSASKNNWGYFPEGLDGNNIMYYGGCDGSEPKFYYNNQGVEGCGGRSHPSNPLGLGGGVDTPSDSVVLVPQSALGGIAGGDTSAFAVFWNKVVDFIVFWK